MAVAEELSEKFAKTNLDEATDRFRAAFRNFTKNPPDIDSVLLILNEEKIWADLAKAQKEKADGQEMIRIGKDKVLNAEEAIEKIVEEFMMKARAHIYRLEWNSAMWTYQLAIEADSVNVDNLWEVAYFLGEQNDFNNAIRFHEMALGQVESESERVGLLHNLGILFKNNQEIEKAEAHYAEALKIRRKLTEKNPRAFDLDVCMASINMSIFYKKRLEETLGFSFREKGLTLILDTEKRLSK